MTEFSRHICDRWGIAESVAHDLCSAFDQGYAPFYLADYDPVIAAEVEPSVLYEVFDFLEEIRSLAPKKKRTLAALTKAGKATPALTERVHFCISEEELDDIAACVRVNPRSAGQVALAKGLGVAAERVLEQRSDEPLQSIIEPLIGTHPTLQTAKNVIDGIRDILAERFAADETVRSMVREYGAEKAFLEVIPKSKKDRTAVSYASKMMSIHEINEQELLALMLAEERKEVRLKVSVQLFQVTELLREHFITNPESEAFDVLCSAIDQCWSNALEPIVEKSVRDLLRLRIEKAVTKMIAAELDSLCLGALSQEQKPYVAIGFFNGTTMSIAAVAADGHLLGASNVNVGHPHPKGSGIAAAASRLAQFLGRYRPTAVLVAEEQYTAEVESTIKTAAHQASLDPLNVKPVVLQDCERTLAEASWMKEKYADLDESMRKTLAIAIAYLKPPGLILQIGPSYFALHPMQTLIPPEKISRFLGRILIERELRKGVPISNIGSSVLTNSLFVPAHIAAELQKPSTCASVGTKSDLLKISEMTDVVFSNIVGYIVIPNAEKPLDRTLVHPKHYGWVEEIAQSIGASIEELIVDPEITRSYICDDSVRKIFIEKRLIDQLRTGQKYQSGRCTSLAKRRLKLAELTEGGIVSGRVTNIAPFGVFVDINAVCDGLVHISQLADTYIESPEQVVSVGDRINVRIVKIDVKKRRISLSMKGLGNLAPKVRPSQGQLNSLADHFKNR